MKDNLKSLFSPILNPFEASGDLYAYKSSHRTILRVIGFLFSLLALGVLAAALSALHFSHIIPIAIFGVAGLVCLVVGFLGSDRAVASIWGNVKNP